MCFLGKGTHITREMCFTGRETHITREMVSQVGEHISLGICVPKKKVGKMAIIGPKPWVNPFGKMSIFRLFDLLLFIP